ncbi:MAG: LytR C-terminal domain-containing protein [Actinomycetota bacterium]|nr:LytR C-terminal domain-containing protein [Actinomycetota bacterium]
MSRRADRGSGRSRDQSGTAGARGALLLAVAVVLGVVLLNSFDRAPTTDVDAILDGRDTTTTVAEDPSVTAPAATSTTRASRAPADVTVLVANGTDIRGLAGATATALKGIGYNTLSPTDTSRPVEATKVLFSDGFEAEARAVATSLQLPPTAVEASTPASPPPIADTLGANVIVLLGGDVSRTTTTAAGATTTTRR